MALIAEPLLLTKFDTRSAPISASVLGLDLRASLLLPVDVEELAARLIDALVGVGAEVVALCLQQVRRQTSLTVAVVIG